MNEFILYALIENRYNLLCPILYNLETSTEKISVMRFFTGIRYYENIQYTRTYFNTIFFTHVSKRAILGSRYALYFSGKDRTSSSRGNLHKGTFNVYSRSFPRAMRFVIPNSSHRLSSNAIMLRYWRGRNSGVILGRMHFISLYISARMHTDALLKMGIWRVLDVWNVMDGRLWVFSSKGRLRGA